MEPVRQLAPLLVGRGTVSNFRDMLRALETIERLDYRFQVHGDVIDEGSATLVKLMADAESSTMIVNGCLFLNAASFRYLDFERDAEDRWLFTLHGDGSTLELIAVPDTTEDGECARPHLLTDEAAADFDLLLAFDDDEDDE